MITTRPLSSTRACKCARSVDFISQVKSVLRSATSSPLAHPVRLVELAKRQGVALADLFAAVGVGDDLEREAIVTAELEIKYAGYFDRERDQAAKMRRLGQFMLDDDLAYDDMTSLSFEARQKL